jgi:DNA repair exonuclease SbcCD ATPase subunit
MHQSIIEALEAYKPLEAEIKTALPSLDEVVINGTWDDNGYKAAKSSLRAAKSVRSTIDKKRKELKAIALEYGRAVDAKGNELMALCDPTINEIERRIAAVDIERERIKNEQRDRRSKELNEVGYAFSMGAYRLGAEIVHPSAMDDATEEDWRGILERGRKEADRLRAEAEVARAEADRLRAEAEKLRAERAELERMQRELEAARNPAPTPAEPTEPTEPTPAAIRFTPQPPAASPEYIAGFNACRSLCIEIVNKYSKRSEMINGINDLTP